MMHPGARAELWGGVECTVNRVGDRYFDQVQRSGHAEREGDLEQLAALGVAAMRYPVLWERVAPDGLDRPAFDWSDARLAQLRAFGIRPIVGLLHHGSGPRDTSLDDPDFPRKFAAFALAVARRYPHVEEWTPINEPVVTARFSGLYGHWYPHKRSDAAFVRMLLNQCRAIALGMRAIRSVNSSARLVHTDDAGTVFSTAPLAAQADFENARRDLALDLLCGRVDAHHPLREYLTAHGATDAELDDFAREPCPPDVIGVNYYATSDRMLDHRLLRHPPDTHGGNDRQLYADLAAVRAEPPHLPAFADVLDRYWQTYGRPVALTEVHLGCTREEQLRWLAEAWRGVREARAKGVPVTALTVWSLLGAYDWDRLVTVDRGHYESGAFDVRSGTPRRTAIFAATRALATIGDMSHPVLAQRGWWCRDAMPSKPTARRRGQRLLILGRTGTLGAALVRACERRAIDVLALGHAEVEIAAASDVKRAIAACQPWAVINAAGYVNVDQAEREEARCMDANAAGAIAVAEACARVGARLLTLSSDLVFDGARHTPYLEHDEPRPLSVYGRSKVAAEAGVLDRLPQALVVRTSAFFDPHDRRNFVARVLRDLDSVGNVRTSRHVVSPTYVPALADALLDLVIDAEQGIWHVAGPEGMSWSDLARRVILAVGGDASRVVECDGDALGYVAPRPIYSALGTARGLLLPALDVTLERYLRERDGIEAAAR
jgi:dTDP-4-dehydrorhamnose reductase